MLALAVVLGVGMVIVVLPGQFGGNEEQRVAGLIATINGEKIKRAEFDKVYQDEIERIEEQNNRILNPVEASLYRGALFERTMEQMLLIQAADRAGLKVSRREVKAEIAKTIDEVMKNEREQLLAGVKGKKTDKLYEARLKEQFNDRTMTLRKRRAMLWKQVSWDEVRQQILMRKLADYWKKSIDSSDEAIRRSYDEIHASQITVSTAKRSEVQARERAREILKKIKDGADFAVVAKQYSEDPFKDRGGDRGPILRRYVGYLDKPLADAMLKLKPGEVSEPIKTQTGYVILKVNKITSALPKDYEKNRKKYREEYMNMMESRLNYEKREELRRSARIKIYDPEIEAYMEAKDFLPMVMYGGYISQEQMPKVRKALKLYQKAADMAANDSQTSGRVFAVMGYIYDALRKPGSPVTEEERLKYRDEAERTLRAAYERTGDNEVDLKLVDIYIEKGKYDLAVEELSLISESLQGSDDIRLHDMTMTALKKVQSLGSPDVAKKAAEIIQQELQWQKAYHESQQPMGGGPSTVTPQPSETGGR
jgi:parvulin-like peptidyl-prolyl isomerase